MGPTLVTVVRTVLDTLLLWQERSAQRKDLMEMDTRMLMDIGISRADVCREVAKPFWRA